MALPELRIRLPAWVEPFVDWRRTYASAEDRMRLAIDLARENVLQRTGGPFGAAVVEAESGRLVSVGVNLVIASHNSVLHGEVVALMQAQARLHSYTLAAEGLPLHELVTSCDPCAMCLGATLWSGVGRLACGAGREDAERIGYDEGPVFPESYAYLEAKGVSVTRGILRADARAVLDLYAEQEGIIY